MRRLLSPGRILALLTGGMLIVFAVAACAFKLMDLDIWWHLKAGEILWNTKQMIGTDPFAFTRDGLPYIARHEWLAQVVFYLVHHVGGDTALILLRTVLALLAVSLPLLIRPSRTLFVVPLAAWVLVSGRALLMDRPQLFTFVLMGGFLLICLSYLLSDAAGSPRSRWGLTRLQTVLLCLFVALQFLWVNMHGAVSVFGLAIAGALCVDRWWNRRPWVPLACCIGAMVAVSLFSPNGLENVRLVIDFLGQKPTQFIREWQPRSGLSHLRDLGPLWIAAIGLLVFRRRHVLFSVLLLVGFGGLSFFAFRHGFLFCLAALAVCAGQLAEWDEVDAWLARRRNTWLTLAVVILLFTGLWLALHRGFNAELRRENLMGYGTFAIAQGAADFLEREQVTGRMFNTYDIGGYLLYRGYPNRKVFMDGRYVDYGLPFLERAFKAGTDKAAWEALVKDYGITYAVINFRASPQQTPFAYIPFLDNNPDWALVYLDDRAAVYARNIPANQELIRRTAYHLLTVNNFAYGSILDTVPSTGIPALEAELRRQTAASSGIVGHILLAQLLLATARPADAQTVLQAARLRAPYQLQIQTLLGQAYADDKQWLRAAQTLEYAITLARLERVPSDVNHEALSSLFQMAGIPWKAATYKSH